MRAINLLPRDDGRAGKEGLNAVVLAGALGGVIVTAIICLLFLSAHSSVATQQAALKQKQAELALIPRPAQDKLKAQDALVADKQARVVAMSAALSRRVAWDRVFREFSLVLPDDVWLLNLSTKAPMLATQGNIRAAVGGAPAASTTPGTGFQIEGYTYSHDAVARLLTRLSVVPDLSDVQLQSSELSKIQGRSIVHFRIGANVRPGGAS